MTDIKANTWAICERVAEAQAMLHDHLEGGRFTADEIVRKLAALLKEEGLLRRNGTIERSAASQESYIFRDKTALQDTGQNGLQRFRKPLLCHSDITRYETPFWTKDAGFDCRQTY